jgi:hypothetical protein
MTITERPVTAPSSARGMASPPLHTSSKRPRPWLRVGAVITVLALAFAYGASLLVLPAARDSAAAADVFSASRAMRHVSVLGASSHPAGSDAMSDVAMYLEDQLRALGLEVQPLTARDPTTGVLLRVVAARFVGTHATGAVLFIGHPDSVPMGPGAGDNATGAATMLETARALTAGPRLRNDTLFVFDDGEELGSYQGGELFAAEHPWAKDVRLAVGLDTAAWGVPFVMQDSDDNGVLIRGYADAVDNPIAMGLDASTNREDDAEIGAFRRRGVPGIEIEDTYANVRQHTAEDRIEFVHPPSLQRMGDQVLALARSYGTLDLRNNTAPDRTFFPLPGLGLVHYPASWGAVLALVAIVLTAVAVTLAFHRRIVRPSRCAMGVAAAVGMVTVGFALAKGAASVYASWRPDPRAGTPSQLAEYLLPSSAPFAIAALTAIAVALVLLWWQVARRIGTAAVGLGFLVVWAAFSALAYAAAPVGAYLFQWPALAAAAAWLWVAARDRGGLALLIPAAVATALLTPQLLLSYFGGGVATLPMLSLASLVVGLAGPALHWTAGHQRGEPA